MTSTVQTIYLLTSFLTVIAAIPQIRQLVFAKQSDQFNLTSWLMFGGNQMMSFAYAVSIGASAYMIVNVAWIGFYAIMIYLILKYRKRRGLLPTIAYWMQRGRSPQTGIISLQADNFLPVAKTAKKM